MSLFWSIFLACLIGLILAVGMLLVILYSRDISAARKRVENLGSQIAHTKCGPVEYISQGEGYPLLVVHGAIGGFDQGLMVAQSLHLVNCRIISVSRFGHLRSPIPENATLDTQADAYAFLLDELKIQHAAVFAISAGTTSAIRFAARHPKRVSMMVLFGPDVPGDTMMALPPRFVFDVLFRNNFCYWFLITFLRKNMQKMMGLVPKGHRLTKKDNDRIRNILMCDLPIDVRIDGVIFETYTTAEDYKNQLADDISYPVRDIKTPVLIVSAQDDPLSFPANVSTMASKFRNARYFGVPDGGHLFFNHEKEVRSEIMGFLAHHIPKLGS